MHAKLNTAKYPGIKQSKVKALKSLLQNRFSSDEILDLETADAMAKLSFELNYPLSLVVNRQGKFISLTVGEPSDVELPELKKFRTGISNLCGHRIIYTCNYKDSQVKINPSDKNSNDEVKIKRENLLCLVKNRLDLLVQIEVNPNNTFSKRFGQHGLYADRVNYVHLLPNRDLLGNLWKVSPSYTVRQCLKQNFEDLILALEEEFQNYQPNSIDQVNNNERAVLVGLITEGLNEWEVEDDLDELSQLAKTAGASVANRLVQSRGKPDPKYFLGSGKIQELSVLVQENQANLVIFDHELNANQQINIEEFLGIKVLDRTELILDIFAQRAQTKEGKLQVELAQLEYLLPRLTGSRQSLSRLGGGIGTRGPGETKLEVDRRVLRKRIDILRKEANQIAKNRQVQRNKRISSNTPLIALTGYTNSGKSTLLNALTKASAFVENKLFATLDPLTRRAILPNGDKILIADTVGFIKKLPTSLVTAFKATLEEIAQAHILVVVVDASHPNALEQIGSVYDVLSDIGIIDKPMITVLNKADLVRDEDLHFLSIQTPNPVIVSAKNRTGLAEFLYLTQEILKLIEKQEDKSLA